MPGAANPPFDRSYRDIPGTFVFDGEQCRKGYRLNMFCMSLNDAANRDAFRADEAGYLDRFALTDDQKTAVLGRQWVRMLELGGNIYYTAKLAGCDGISFQQVAATQCGMTEEAYVEMMLSGGRPIDGNRSRSEWAGPEHGDAHHG